MSCYPHPLGIILYYFEELALQYRLLKPPQLGGWGDLNVT